MSAASRPLPAPARSGLLAKLMAQVRAEFRVEIYLAGPDDSVLGRRPCSVSDCDRSRAEYGSAPRTVGGGATGAARRWPGSSPTRGPR